jgi:hypothetical protein
MAPLRDRLPSNTTEPEWPPQSVTTPLRIAKRDTPQRQHASQLSRRTSNTFTKLTRSNLVTQSPFLSQSSPSPSPSRPSSATNALSPRRVSGEKRPRPESMQSHVENVRPLGPKRRQSKGFQDLVEKEPVKKSPFRRPVYPTEDPFPPPPPPPKVTHQSHLPTPSSSASPGRSSLVTKRFHGPREIGRDVAKRQRRKTVTFEETCEVVTYERDDSLEDPLFSDDPDDDHVEPEDEEEPAGGVEANDSLTGLVDSMIQDARGASSPHTPPMDRILPPHMDSEDGVPYGRTHHADRVALSRTSHPTPPLEISETLTSVVRESPAVTSTPPQNQSAGSTMPLGRSTHSERARVDRMPDELEEDVRMLPPSPSPAKAKKYPFGDGDCTAENLLPKFDLDVHRKEGADDTGACSKSAVRSLNSMHKAGGSREDPFGLPARDDVQIVELSFMSSEGVPGSPYERSAGLQQTSQAVQLEEELGLGTPNSQIRTSTPPLKLKSPAGSLGKSAESPGSRGLPRPPRWQSESPLPNPHSQTTSFAESRSGSPSLPYPGSPSSQPTSGSPAFAPPTPMASPFPPALESMPSNGSLNSHESIGSLSRRNPRIDREDIHKRLLRKRNADSPMPEELGEMSTTANRPTNGDATDTQLDEMPLAALRTLMSRPIHRERTYDGVMSIDPNPQPADPPRPSVLVRAHTETETGDTHGAGTSDLHGRDFSLPDGNTTLDLSLGAGSVEISEVRSALERLVQDVVTDSAGASMSARPSPQDLKVKGSHSSLRIASVTKGIKARLYDPLSDLDVTMEEDEMLDDHDEIQHELLSGGGFMSPTLSRNTSESSDVPQTQQRDAIRHREQMILEKRREMRRREQDEDMGYVTPPRNPPHPGGRPSARRSMSTGDAEDLQEATRRAALNPLGSSVLPDVIEKDPFAESIARELSKLRGSSKGVRLHIPPSQWSAKPILQRYHVRQHSETIYASLDADRVSHVDGAGDIDNGRAWRTIRRPSDMVRKLIE